MAKGDKSSARAVTPRPRPPRLSRERILRAALDVVERDGLAALSMRRLAEELDVWPMSVYRYFQDKDALLDAIAASAAGDVRLSRDSATWREQIHDLLHEARGAMGATPSELADRWSRAFLTPGALRLSEAALTALESAGFSKEEAATAWRALWSYTFGFAMFALAPTPAEAARVTRTAIATLPEEDYPTLAGSAAELSVALSDEAEFDRGLEHLLDGLEAALAEKVPT